MTSTVLHGLDDGDIPEKFTDELLIAVGDEVMARPAVLLNALLLAGWTPPSANGADEADRLRARLDNVLDAMRWDTEQIEEARRLFTSFTASRELTAEWREAAQLWLSLNTGSQVIE